MGEGKSWGEGSKRALGKDGEGAGGYRRPLKMVGPPGGQVRRTS